MQTTSSLHGTFWKVSLWCHLKCSNMIRQSNCLLSILGVSLAGIRRSFVLIVPNIGPWNKLRTLFQGHMKVALTVKTQQLNTPFNLERTKWKIPLPPKMNNESMSTVTPYISPSLNSFSALQWLLATRVQHYFLVFIDAKTCFGVLKFD